MDNTSDRKTRCKALSGISTALVVPLALIACERAGGQQEAKVAEASRSCSETPLAPRYRPGCLERRSQDGPADPARVLADVCPAGTAIDGRCEGRFGKPTGSGGAQVLSFRTVRMDREAKDFEVMWKCPDWSGLVRVTVRIGDYVVHLKEQCSAERIRWPINVFRTYRVTKASAMASVEVWSGDSPCRIPTYLLAHLVVPSGLFQPEKNACAKNGVTDACLTVHSNFSAIEWGIDLGATPLEKGSGAMLERHYTIPTSQKCHPVFVDFFNGERPRAAPTCISELRF